jgi:hypothetical protein
MNFKKSQQKEEASLFCIMMILSTSKYVSIFSTTRTEYQKISYKN